MNSLRYHINRSLLIHKPNINGLIFTSHTSAVRHASASMKRKTPPTKESIAAKRSRSGIHPYHLTPSVRDESGEPIWPAPNTELEAAKKFILDCANSHKRTSIIPDKDADGLASGVILYRTLTLLGLSPDLITVHLVQKGNSIHSETERESIAASSPEYIFVLDQGSRKSSPLIDLPHKGLIIDHHYAEPGDVPYGAQIVSACNSPPVATSSLLTYIICTSLHSEVQRKCDWVCAIGTHGDLGGGIKWESPFPDMGQMFKAYTKKAINDSVSLINAPRRTAAYDVQSAWQAFLAASNPKELQTNPCLHAARQEINAEVERCTHTAPKFSIDGTVAVFRIASRAQVHPVIATRWAGYLKSAKLEIVLVANTGYIPGQVNFSCRIPKCAKARDSPVNIIASLREIAKTSPSGDLLERLGDSFARGHKEASGGIVGVEEFEELMACMRVGEKPEMKPGQEAKKGKKDTTQQKNTLINYFKK